MHIEELFSLVESGDAETLKKVLAENPDLAKAEMGAGFTPLALATQCGQLECLRVLLPLSDPARAVVGNRSNPLMLAVWKGEIECLKELLAVSDANQRNIVGETALMIAARNGQVEAVRLLAPKTDASATDLGGLNSLMLAAESGELACVEILANWCDAEMKNLEGLNAMEVAIMASQWNCADFLAARRSEQAARELMEMAPKEASLPRCKALLEQAQLRQELAGQRAAQEGHSQQSLAWPTKASRKNRV